MAIALSGSLILSGSIIVSGSITSTGTVIMSGSIASASYALNATTGAYANTSTSASYALNATTFNGLASSIFATTGSNTFIGNQVVSGSLTTSGSITATGTITAQTLVIQTITSSVVYSSGSNIFGNAIGNTQTFTGSVLVTGSLTISTGGNASAPIIFGSTIACSPIGCFATSCATSFIGGTMSGTTIYGSTAVCSPVGKFTSCIDAGSGIFSSSVTAGADITANDTSVGSTFLYLKGNATTGVAGVRFARANTGAQMGKIDYDFGTDLMTFRAGGNDRMYLTSGGTLGIGVTPSCWTLLCSVQIRNVAFAGYTTGNTHILYAGNNWYYGGCDKYIANGFASLYSQADGVHAWYNASCNVSGVNTVLTFCERMRITSTGNVGINNSNPLAMLDITLIPNAVTKTRNTCFGSCGLVFLSGLQGTTNSEVGIFGGNSIGSLSAGIGMARANSSDWDTHLRFYTHISSTSGDPADITEKMRITGDGYVGIGTTNPSTILTISKAIDVAGYGCGTRMIDFKSYFAGYDTDTVKASIYSGVSCLPSLNTQGGFMAFMTSNDGTLAERIRIEKNGYVGIATKSPQYQLDVVGDINSTTNISSATGLFSGNKTVTISALNTAYQFAPVTSGIVTARDNTNGGSGIWLMDPNGNGGNGQLIQSSWVNGTYIIYYSPGGTYVQKTSGNVPVLLQWAILQQ